MMALYQQLFHCMLVLVLKMIIKQDLNCDTKLLYL